MDNDETLIEDFWSGHPDEDGSKAFMRYAEGGWDVTGQYAYEESLHGSFPY